MDKKDRAAIEMAEFAARYFNIYLGDWTDANKEVAGRELLKAASLLMLADAPTHK